MKRLIPAAFAGLALAVASPTFAQVPSGPTQATGEANALDPPADAEVEAEVDAPAIDAPKVDTPDVDAPTVEAPAVDADADVETPAGKVGAGAEADVETPAGRVRGDAAINGAKVRARTPAGDVEAGANVDGRGQRGRARAGAGADASRPALGVMLQPGAEGVIVTRVQPGSPAASIGLRAGDQILSINGTEYTAVDGFIDGIAQASIDEDAEIVFLRNGVRETAMVRLAPTGAVFGAGVQAGVDPTYSPDALPIPESGSVTSGYRGTLPPAQAGGWVEQPGQWNGQSQAYGYGGMAYGYPGQWYPSYGYHSGYYFDDDFGRCCCDD